MRTREEIVEYLFSRTTRGVKFGLEKIGRACDTLGNPQSAFRTIHVAGTNGKGSTCACIEAILRAHGFRTGMFLSPHLVEIEERFLVDGVPVGPGEWSAVYRDVEHLIADPGMTFFEALTLIAFELFRRMNVEWCVCEVGMGGRLDATNVVQPEVSVITRIGDDHREYLGNDLATVASEKLGIVKSGVPVVMAGPEIEAVRGRALEVCAARGAPLRFVEPGDIRDISGDPGGTRFRYAGRRRRVGLIGDYQAANAALALCCADVLGLDELNALETVRLPGRLQQVCFKGVELVFDVGHNGDAAEVLVRALRRRFESSRVTFVCGIMKDKDRRKMIAAYAAVARGFIFCRPATDRAEEPAALASLVPKDFTGVVQTANCVDEAVREACRDASAPVCVTGSFYTVGEAMRALGVRPYG